MEAKEISVRITILMRFFVISELRELYIVAIVDLTVRPLYTQAKLMLVAIYRDKSFQLP